MADGDSDSGDELLQELLWTYGPCGQEDAVRAVCARELEPVVDDMWIDDAGNLIGFVGAAAGSGADAAQSRHRWTPAVGPGTGTRVMAHMDELSMLVKRVEPDGTINFPYVGRIKAAGRSEDELGRAVGRRLVELKILAGP